MRPRRLDAVDVAVRECSRLARGPRRFRDGVRSTQIYMVLLVVFCTNAVNIYAGVNGLECGQVYVIACSILAMAAVELQHNQNENYTLSLVFLLMGLVSLNELIANFTDPEFTSHEFENAHGNDHNLWAVYDVIDCNDEGVECTGPGEVLEAGLQAAAAFCTTSDPAATAGKEGLTVTLVSALVF